MYRQSIQVTYIIRKYLIHCGSFKDNNKLNMYALAKNALTDLILFAKNIKRTMKFFDPNGTPSRICYFSIRKVRKNVKLFARNVLRY